MKKLLSVRRSDEPHWVGDGFPVRTIFTYNDVPKEVSPFLLMDYAGPVEFPPTDQILGVGEHPHRGFETVTIVYAGEVEHRDSAGGGGKIGPNDIQWMTAASGLVHEEKHGREFAKRGGTFEMVQLWVNLPRKYKMSPPRYQGIRGEHVPIIPLPNEAGSLRVIAGDFADQRGPAETFSPVQVWDVRLNGRGVCELRMPRGYTTLVFVLAGQVQLAGGETIGMAELAVLDRDEELFSLKSIGASKVLILGGEPINEPVVGYGPFVMNEVAEIRQAIQDFEEGKMGRFK